jgi:hypothetical protein
MTASQCDFIPTINEYKSGNKLTINKISIDTIKTMGSSNTDFNNCNVKLAGLIQGVDNLISDLTTKCSPFSVTPLTEKKVCQAQINTHKLYFTYYNNIHRYFLGMNTSYPALSFSGGKKIKNKKSFKHNKNRKQKLKSRKLKR